MSEPKQPPIIDSLRKAFVNLEAEGFVVSKPRVWYGAQSETSVEFGVTWNWREPNYDPRSHRVPPGVSSWDSENKRWLEEGEVYPWPFPQHSQTWLVPRDEVEELQKWIGDEFSDRDEYA